MDLLKFMLERQDKNTAEEGEFFRINCGCYRL